MAKKYISLDALQTFLDNCKNIFASSEDTTNLQDELSELDEILTKKSQVQIITWEVND